MCVKHPSVRNARDAGATWTNIIPHIGEMKKISMIWMHEIQPVAMWGENRTSGHVRGAQSLSKLGIILCILIKKVNAGGLIDQPEKAGREKVHTREQAVFLHGLIPHGKCREVMDQMDNPLVRPKRARGMHPGPVARMQNHKNEDVGQK